MNNEEIKRYMVKSLENVPDNYKQQQTERLRKIVVGAIESNRPVDWSKMPIPNWRESQHTPNPPKGGPPPPPPILSSPRAVQSSSQKVPSKGSPKRSQTNANTKSTLPSPISSSGSVNTPSNRKESPSVRSIPVSSKRPGSTALENGSSKKKRSSANNTGPASNTAHRTSSMPQGMPALPTNGQPPTMEQMMAMAAMFKKYAPPEMAHLAPPLPNFPPAVSRPQPVSSIGTLKMTQQEREMAEKRRLRFQTQEPVKNERSQTPISADPHSVVGECETLEKSYLRLTSAPDPCKVRPKRVLKKSFPYVLERYSENKSYDYIKNQLKSIRQDMNVQGIRDGFTVRVYEKNVCIALANGDLGEFNQCISQLKELYFDPTLSFALSDSSGEFLGYQIYYLLFTQARQDLDIMIYKIHKTPLLKENPKIQTALKIVDALFTENWPMIFLYYSKADSLSKIAMRPLIQRERLGCIAGLSKSRRHSTIPIEELKSAMKFDTVEDACAFIKQFSKHVIINECGEEELDCKNAHGDFHMAWESTLKSKVDIKGQM